MVYGILSVWLLFLAVCVYVGGNDFGFGVFFMSAIGFALWWNLGRKKKAFDQGIRDAIRQGKASRGSSQPSPQKVYHGYDHTCSPVFSKLVTACNGDRAAAERLIAHEMKRDRKLSPNAATVAALDRLYMDRRHSY